MAIGHLRACVLVRLERKTSTLLSETWRGMAPSWRLDEGASPVWDEPKAPSQAFLLQLPTETSGASSECAPKARRAHAYLALTLYPYICRGVRSELCL